MDESKWEFLQENWGLISEVARKWRNRGCQHLEKQELEHAALMLAVACLKSWDSSKSTFSTYYYSAARNPEKFIDRGLLVHHHKDNDYQAQDSLNSYYRDGDGGFDEIGNRTASSELTDEEALDNIESEQLRRVVHRLPDDLRAHALRMLFGEVDWKDVEATRELQARTMEALRREMR